MSQYGRFISYTAVAENLIGNDGVVVSPIGGNIHTVGATPLYVFGNAGTATTTVAIVGLTNHALLIGDATGNMVSMSTVGATGQGLMGNTGADPSWTGSPTFSGTVTGTTGLATINGDLVVTCPNAYPDTGAMSFVKTSAGGATVTGDILGDLNWYGHDGSGTLRTTLISSTSSGTIATGRIASNLQFWTHPDSVAANPTLRMTIASTGETTIAAPDSGRALTITAGGETITAGGLTVTAGGIVATANDIETSNGSVNIGENAADALASNLQFKKSRPAGPTPVITTGDALGQILYSGNDGTNYIVASKITSTSSGTIATNRVASDLKFYTHPDSTAASTLRMTIAPTGEVTIEPPDSGTGLTISGSGMNVTGNSLLPQIGTKTTVGNTTLLQAYNTNTSTYTTFATLTAGNPPTMDLASGVTIGTNYIYRAGGTDVAVADGGTGVSTLTVHGVLIGNAASAVNVTAAGSAGQVLTSGGASADPAWTTATYPSDVTLGDVLYASADHVVGHLAKDTNATRYLSNTGTSNAPAWAQVALATGVSGTLGVGNGGTGATTLTIHGVLIGNTTSAIQATAAGTANQFLISGGASADPAWSTYTMPTTPVQGDMLYASSATVISQLAKDTNATRYLSNTGTSNNPAWAQIALGTGVSGTLGIGNGGTGASTLTAHGVLIGNATSAINSTTAGSAGQILVSAGASADPTWTTLTIPGTVAIGDVLIATSANTLTAVTGAATSGYVLTANGAGTSPTFQANAGGGIGTLNGDSGSATGATVTIAGGTGITTSATGSTVTITNSGGFAWSVITADQNAAVNNGYICNKAGLLTLTLPTTAAAGTVIRVSGMNTATGWKIAQNANQIIHFSGVATTTGTGGSLASSAIRDSVELVCCVANLEWNVVSSIGNITIV